MPGINFINRLLRIVLNSWAGSAHAMDGTRVPGARLSVMPRPLSIGKAIFDETNMYAVRFRNTFVAYMPIWFGLTMSRLAYLPRTGLGRAAPMPCERMVV